MSGVYSFDTRKVGSIDKGVKWENFQRHQFDGKMFAKCKYSNDKFDVIVDRSIVEVNE